MTAPLSDVSDPSGQLPIQLIARPFIDAPLKGAARHAVSTAELLAKSGIASKALDDPLARLSHHEYTRFMGRLWQLTNDEFMGLAPVSSPYGTFAMMCKAIISCSSLEHALHRANSFYRLFPNAPALSITKEVNTTKLEIVFDDQYDTDHFLSESLLVIWHRLSSWLIGQGIPLFAVGCRYSAPKHAQLYRELFATPVLFGQDSTYLLIPSAILSLPISQSPATLRTFLKYSPANMLARPNPHESTTGKLRQLLSRHAVNALPDLLESANLMGLSNATLRRRLAAENTSFQRIKDELRQAEACFLLAQQDIDIRDVAEHLGFTETSTFHRAFRKWQGVTPGEFRLQQRIIKE